MDTVDEEKSEAGHGEERRQRIEWHAEGAREIGTPDAQKDDADLLQEELQQDARDDQQSDDLREREKQKKAPTRPSTTSARWGMPCFGCTAARKLK